MLHFVLAADKTPEGQYKIRIEEAPHLRITLRNAEKYLMCVERYHNAVVIANNVCNRDIARTVMDTWAAHYAMKVNEDNIHADVIVSHGE